MKILTRLKSIIKKVWSFIKKYYKIILGTIGSIIIGGFVRGLFRGKDKKKEKLIKNNKKIIKKNKERKNEVKNKLNNLDDSYSKLVRGKRASKATK